MQSREFDELIAGRDAKYAMQEALSADTQKYLGSKEPLTEVEAEAVREDIASHQVELPADFKLKIQKFVKELEAKGKSRRHILRAVKRTFNLNVV